MSNKLGGGMSNKLVYDTNTKHGLALVADEGMNHVAYVPLTECDSLESARVYGHYLKQMHYVARTSAVGLTANTKPMLDGWAHAGDMGL